MKEIETALIQMNNKFAMNSGKDSMQVYYQKEMNSCLFPSCSVNHEIDSIQGKSVQMNIC